jgi:hypothetical protein
LIDYRFAVFHWMMLHRPNLKIDWRSWKMEDFLRDASSKLKVLIQVILRYIKDKDAPPLICRREDGELVPSPQVGQPPVLRPRKFIVFALYHLPRQVIKKVRSFGLGVTARSPS